MIELFPVFVALDRAAPRRERFQLARPAVVAALAASARRAGAPEGLPFADWPRDERGAPCPVQGWHASFADTTGAVLGLVASVPCAVDVEWLERPRWEAARALFESAGELERLGGGKRADVLALWTAKEALLKLAGIGLADLGRVPLVARHARGFRLAHHGREHEVLVRQLGSHLCAVAGAARARVLFATHQGYAPTWHVHQGPALSKAIAT